MPNRAAALIFALSGFAAGATAADADAREFFEMRVRPVLVKRCFACHTSGRKGELEMSGREALLKGGSRGPAISLDNLEASLLVQAVSYKLDNLKMPPAGKLPDNEIQDLTTWVKAGAVWPAADKPSTSKGPAYVISAEQRAFW